MKYLIVLAILINGYMAGTDLDPFFEATPTRDHVVSTISVTNGGQWGSWMTAVYCPNGSFANGYAMKVGIYMYHIFGLQRECLGFACSCDMYG